MLMGVEVGRDVALGSEGKTMTTAEVGGRREPSGLSSDEPTPEDLLSFDAVAGTVIDAVLDDALDPLAMGVSGAWGSGKTTILRLIEVGLAGEQVLVVSTDPWRYDPGVGAKETLISEVLSAVGGQIREPDGAEGVISNARKLLTKLKEAQAAQAVAAADLARINVGTRAEVINARRAALASAQLAPGSSIRVKPVHEPSKSSFRRSVRHRRL